MGLAIQRSSFADEEYARAAVRLDENLEALRLLLDRPGFGVGPPSLGAELEVSIVDANAEALPLNREVLAESLDPQLQLELDRFNLEYNLSPVTAAGAPFSVMQAELTAALAKLGVLAGRHGGRIVPIGILPTLRKEQLQSGWMTDLPRYQALASGIRRLRDDDFRIRINGEEPLDTTFDCVTIEGANTSFQVHLRVDPADFARYYNAAQLVTPLALAVAANSPFLLGHKLWDETRIALFKQSVDTRGAGDTEWRRAARVPFGHGWVRQGALELFAESCRLFPIIIPLYNDEDVLGMAAAGETPELAELRLHQGTIWNWNRPVFDAADGGHLRIELRSLPSGPTPVDMLANAAFLVGMTVGFATKIDSLLPAFPFRYAEYNFYRAAQSGLRAELLWPTLNDTSPRTASAEDLCRESLPMADEGLAILGIDETERRRFLDPIRDRLKSRQTPATWQRRSLDNMPHNDRHSAMQALVESYLEKLASGRSVSDW